MYDDIRSSLSEAEGKVRALKEERSRLSTIAESAKSAYEQTDGDEGEPTFKTAAQAKLALREIDEKIEAATQEQVSALKTLGDQEAGFGLVNHVSGWKQAAQEIDLAAGKLTVDVAGASLKRGQERRVRKSSGHLHASPQVHRLARYNPSS